LENLVANTVHDEISGMIDLPEEQKIKDAQTIARFVRKNQIDRKNWGDLTILKSEYRASLALVKIFLSQGFSYGEITRAYEFRSYLADDFSEAEKGASLELLLEATSLFVDAVDIEYFADKVRVAFTKTDFKSVNQMLRYLIEEAKHNDICYLDTLLETRFNL